MVDYKYKDLFYKRNIDKQLKIVADDGLFTATNSDIKWENFELTESLCSDSELHFGSCEPSMVKFQVLNDFIPLSGKFLTVTEVLSEKTDEPFRYGKYKVLSDKPTADKEYRDIVAYDAMYDILSADTASWYNTILPNKDSTVTLKQFRENFLQHFGLAEVAPEGGLVNDGMTVERTIEPEQISGKDVIMAICEINGCFGHIGRDGKFHYIYLEQKETEDSDLQTQGIENIGENAYIKCKYEDYVVRGIDKLQIRQEKNDIGAIYPQEQSSENDNTYIIEDNFLVYGKSAEELDAIAENIFSKITSVVYRPLSMECVGNPCLEVGDRIKAETKYATVESYILSRTLKWIQNKRDSYSAKGSEKQTEEVNYAQKSIIQLKGKTNTLERTVEETRSEIKDLESGVSSQIVQLAEEIQLEVSRATGSEIDLAAAISVALGEIALKVSKDGVIQAINLSTEEGITINASKVNLAGYLQVGMLADMDNPTGWVITKHPGDENANYIYGIRGSGNNLVIKTGGDVAFAAGLPEDYKPGDSTAGSALQLYHDGKILISAINFKKEDGTLSGWLDYGDIMSGTPNFSTIDVARSVSTDEYGNLLAFKGSASTEDDVPTKAWVEEYVKKNGGGKGFANAVTCKLIQDTPKTIAVKNTDLHTYVTTYTEIQ